MILHFDFSTGASGDKILGSLVELCESLGVASFAEVARIGASLVPGVAVERRVIKQGGIDATGIVVQETSPPHRHWDEIRDLIVSAGCTGVLTEQALQLSLAAFEAIAEAEAAVHGLALDHVHFHEIGAADSIIDICCSSYLLDKLAPEAVFATPLALGFGSFICSHGEMSVPAPATTLLIDGLPVYAGVHEGELTTPTGAALARTFVSEWTQLPSMKPCAVGYGAGSRTIPGAANVVRVIAGEHSSLAGLIPVVGVTKGKILRFAQDDRERVAQGDRGGVVQSDRLCCHSELSEESSCQLTDETCCSIRDYSDVNAAFTIEGCTLLETNIDHLSPEAMAFACEELLTSEIGALDVWQEPITMKKGRLAVRLCVLAQALDAQRTAEAIVRLTGTLGVRSTYVERTVVPREVTTKPTVYGDLHYKTALVSTPSGQIKLQRPEYEDVARIAREQSLDFNRLYEELNK